MLPFSHQPVSSISHQFRIFAPPHSSCCHLLPSPYDESNDDTTHCVRHLNEPPPREREQPSRKTTPKDGNAVASHRICRTLSTLERDLVILSPAPAKPPRATINPGKAIEPTRSAAFLHLSQPHHQEPPQISVCLGSAFCSHSDLSAQ